MTWILLVAGFVLLVAGAEYLVRGAASLAMDFGISPLVVGLTVVAFGTSSPELAVSVFSSLKGQAGLALGNVVGSNICNVLVILGLSALVAPLVVSRQVVRLEVPIMIGVSFLLVGMALDGTLARWEGVILFVGAVVYTGWTVNRSLRENKQKPADDEVDNDIVPSSRPMQIVQIVGGLVLLGLGSRWLVQGAVTIAQHFGVSDLVIGLTVVAIGTSLPELATSVLASIRGQRDIAVGNVVGSNIFNILVVLGLTAAVVPGGVPVPRSALTFDLPVMLVVAVACLPIFLTGHRIARREGALFFAYYGIYAAFLIMTAMEHEAKPLLAQAVLIFVIPLTLLTLGISLWRHFRVVPYGKD
ncbi:calcium/sodium antiporter [Desulfuromonas sp. AOP6]|uniref:calcium/sodium antiporter n=1 Tax=Desulfuromonas sp. AOP6 TaxID=1566351 RepID=UPI001CEC6519|nr:calcium/sodium antiporter [Desulfuromonas sp. AOP6]